MRADTECGQSGLSLVELMIAITLGLMLIAVVTSVFLGSNRSYKQNDTEARIQEDGRNAMDFLAHSLSMADFWGTMTNPGVIGSTLNPNTLCNNITFNDPHATPIAVLDMATPAAINTQYGTCVPQNIIFDPSDALEIQRVSGMSTTALNANDVYLQTNGSIGTIVAPPASVMTGMTYWQVASEVYFVQNHFNQDANGNALDTIPTLARVTVTFQNGAPVASPPTPIVPGIEAFRIQFGIDTDNDGVANYYTFNPGALISKAVTARIFVVSRALAPDTTYSDDKTYHLDGDSGDAASLYQIPAGGKQYRRQVFSRTVLLRNPRNWAALGE